MAVLGFKLAAAIAEGSETLARGIKLASDYLGQGLHRGSEFIIERTDSAAALAQARLPAAGNPNNNKAVVVVDAGGAAAVSPLRAQVQALGSQLSQSINDKLDSAADALRSASVKERLAQAKVASGAAVKGAPLSSPLLEILFFLIY